MFDFGHSSLWVGPTAAALTVVLTIFGLGVLFGALVF